MEQEIEHLNSAVTDYLRTDFPKLRDDLTIQQALDTIRKQGIGEKIVYFYVVDSNECLVGVLPTRRLLTAPLDQRICDLMARRIIAIPHTATVLDACELFVMHKFLAFPVVDQERRMLGIIDVNLFTEEVIDMAQREKMEDVFEAIGFRVSQVRDASPWRALRFRFPWLLTNICSGTICALLASAFELTLAKSLVLAFFLTLVLGLGESVSIQSMTVTIQALRSIRPTFRWFANAFWRELGTAFLLGGACGTLVGLIVWLWRGAPVAAFVIGSSIFLTVCAACLFGLCVPALLHRLKLDPKIAAGPVTLALTDVATLLSYFTLAAAIL